MLRLRLRPSWLVVVGAVIAGMTLHVAPAVAGPRLPRADPPCLETTTKVDDSTGLTQVVCVRYASETSTTDTSDDSSDDTAAGAAPVCKDAAQQVIDCVAPDGGVWSRSRLCYAKVADPQLPVDDPAWEGHTDGVIIECSQRALYPDECTLTPSNGVEPQKCVVIYYWAAQGPDQAGPSPKELADQVVASMQLHAGKIAMAPPSYTVRPGSMFVVGIQAWLWVDDPGESTTGPMTRSASAGGLTVTATATLDRIVYDMGDGGSVTCHGPSTPYTAAWDDADSPDCGYTYTQPSSTAPGGIYTITAHSYWNVQWSGGDQSGTIPVDLTSSVPVKVGEIQVLVNS